MKPKLPESRPEPTERDIQKAAYFLWLEQGRPEGRDEQTWLTAKELLRHPISDASYRSAPRKPRGGLRSELSDTNI